jgi:hypothetical protein
MTKGGRLAALRPLIHVGCFRDPMPKHVRTRLRTGGDVVKVRR